MDHICIKGAREHNLKNFDLVLPRNKLVVITGLSGSGKSSLAFDTLYAEGQRRYVESLSAYARQFLDQMEKPDVDSIDGLSPAISIEQKTTSKNPRSTVATVTEIYDYFRLLYARVGKPVCAACALPIASQTIQDMTDQILSRPEGARIQLLAPVVRSRKGEHKKLLGSLIKSGYIRARIDGQMVDLTDGIPTDLDKQKKHNIEVVIDRLIVFPEISTRLADSLEITCNLADGIALVDIDGDEILLSSNLACSNVNCQRFGLGLLSLEPRSFSFNSPFGACPVCDGLGFKRQFVEELIVPNPALSLGQGCICAVGWKNFSEDSWRGQFLEQLANVLSFSLDTPWEELSLEIRHIVLYGLEKNLKFVYQKKDRHYEFIHNFKGIIGNLERRYKEAISDEVRAKMEGIMRLTSCESCSGMRLRPEVLSIFIGGLNISELTALSVREAWRWFSDLNLAGKDAAIAEKILKEIKERLVFLDDVGLGYLTLNRSAATLSGGEGQRIRLATQILLVPEIMH
jgi:excinuclease ABC subunit A